MSATVLTREARSPNPRWADTAIVWASSAVLCDWFNVASSALIDAVELPDEAFDPTGIVVAPMGVAPLIAAKVVSPRATAPARFVAMSPMLVLFAPKTAICAPRMTWLPRRLISSANFFVSIAVVIVILSFKQ
jgi:hypothetical protein